jgi:hypothetical protein
MTARRAIGTFLLASRGPRRVPSARKQPWLSQLSRRRADEATSRLWCLCMWLPVLTRREHAFEAEGGQGPVARHIEERLPLVVRFGPHRPIEGIPSRTREIRRRSFHTPTLGSDAYKSTNWNFGSIPKPQAVIRSKEARSVVSATTLRAQSAF